MHTQSARHSLEFAKERLAFTAGKVHFRIERHTELSDERDDIKLSSTCAVIRITLQTLLARRLACNKPNWGVWAECPLRLIDAALHPSIFCKTAEKSKHERSSKLGLKLLELTRRRADIRRRQR